MLTIIVPGLESYDEVNEVFISTPDTELHLEHSLRAVAAWESQTCKPFIGNEAITRDEFKLYVKCMTINKNVDDNVYNALSVENEEAIRAYIGNPYSATTFSKESEKAPGGMTSKDFISSELMYYWMVAFNIPPEYQNWHLNRLINLIRICSIKRAEENEAMSGKKNKVRTPNSINLASRAALNAQRKAAYHTHG